MSPRTGRPKSENPKERSVRVRFNDDQYERLGDYCIRHGTSKAQAIRDSVEKMLSEEGEDETAVDKKGNQNTDNEP